MHYLHKNTIRSFPKERDKTPDNVFPALRSSFCQFCTWFRQDGSSYTGGLGFRYWKALYPSFQPQSPLTPLSPNSQLSKPSPRALDPLATRKSLWLFWLLTNRSDQHLSSSLMYFLACVLSSCSLFLSSGSFLYTAQELPLFRVLSDSDFSLPIIPSV